MKLGRQDKLCVEKIRHYTNSTERCIKNLIALSKMTDKVKLDAMRLRQMLELLEGVIKEK